METVNEVKKKILLKDIQTREYQPGKKVFDFHFVLEGGKDEKEGYTFIKEAENWTKGDVIEVLLQPGKEYKGKKRYYITNDQAKKTVSIKDWKFEKRKTALESAIKFSKSPEETITIANKLYDWLCM